MQNKTTILINGRVYDAKTGSLLRDNATPAPATMQRAVAPKKQFVDGFVRTKHMPVAPNHTTKRTAAPQASSSISVQHTKLAAPHSAHHAKAAEAGAVHVKQHKSATLMRKAVKAPAKPHASVQKVQPKRGFSVKTLHGEVAVSARSRLAAAPIKKLAHKAAAITKSDAIHHFANESATSTPAVGREPLAVTIKPIALKHPEPAALSHHHAATPHIAAHKPSHAMLQKGLMAANSHEEHFKAYKNNTRRKLLSAGAGTLAVLLLAGYIAYINIPNIAMRVAANKAGFNAAMPDNPAGYALKGPIKYAPGRITFTLRSNSSDKSVAITERTSNWDSQTLLKNHVRPTANGNYEAVESAGRTLYIFGQSVTWVHGGIWYQVDGNDQLGRDQLIKLATSM